MEKRTYNGREIEGNKQASGRQFNAVCYGIALMLLEDCKLVGLAKDWPNGGLSPKSSKASKQLINSVTNSLKGVINSICQPRQPDRKYPVTDGDVQGYFAAISNREIPAEIVEELSNTQAGRVAKLVEDLPKAAATKLTKYYAKPSKESVAKVSTRKSAESDEVVTITMKEYKRLPVKERDAILVAGTPRVIPS